MKSYVVLFVALTMLVKPLWPVGEYIMNYDYIVNILCENKDKPELECDGKCYLSKMLAKESKQNKENPFGDKQLIETFQILHVAPTLNLNSGNLSYTDPKVRIAFSQNLISFLLISKIVHPPELV